MLGSAAGPYYVSLAVEAWGWNLGYAMLIGTPLMLAGLLYLALDSLPSGLEIEEIETRQRRSAPALLPLQDQHTAADFGAPRGHRAQAIHRHDGRAACCSVQCVRGMSRSWSTGVRPLVGHYSFRFSPSSALHSSHSALQICCMSELAGKT